MNRMARIPEMLEPIRRPTFWRNTWPLKEKYMLVRVTVRRSIMSCLERWSVRSRILSAALVIAFCMGIKVYRDTTSRLHGYGSVLLMVKSPAWTHVMSSRLFQFQMCRDVIQLWLKSVCEQPWDRWVGLLVLDTMGRILISRPVLWVSMRW